MRFHQHLQFWLNHSYPISNLISLTHMIQLYIAANNIKCIHIQIETNAVVLGLDTSREKNTFRKKGLIASGFQTTWKPSRKRLCRLSNLISQRSLLLGRAHGRRPMHFISEVRMLISRDDEYCVIYHHHVSSWKKERASVSERPACQKDG